MDNKVLYRIFVINPGSTSSKLSVYENEREVLTEDIFHDAPVLLRYPTINDQLPFRMEVLRDFLDRHGLKPAEFDAVVGRGGCCHPVESGVYYVDEQLVRDCHNCVSGVYHSSMLGVQMAWELYKEHKCLTLMLDPTVMDELDDLARITGVRGVYRRAATHALNLKATARKHAKAIGKRYEDCRFIVCHIDGGISVTAHKLGRQVDANNASGGEGPFSPTRMGGMAVTDIVGELWDRPAQEMKKLCSHAGGLTSHFGTSDSDAIHAMVDAGNPRATRVWNAMIYQTAKYIGEMAVVLEGEVDAIVLTGGLLRFADVVEGIRTRCGWIAPIATYPGENEQEAMALGALRVLRGEEQPKTYTGRPVWEGFPDEE